MADGWTVARQESDRVLAGRRAGRQHFGTATVCGASGIGQATVERLGSEGMRVAFLDINAEAGIHMEQQLRARMEAWYIRCDVLDGAAVEQVMDAVVERWGTLDVLVNAAVIDIQLAIRGWLTYPKV